jgi:predicted AAA+ superfamily ATPase
MPHRRKRLLLPVLKKRLSFFPIVAIQGARQIGKSFLVRELLKESFPSLVYESFDDQTTRTLAEESPRTFLTERVSKSPLVIDEAQKVPAIFDALKFNVDQKRVPGRFVILGSTEFSRLSKIRESLTGRMGKIRMYPLTYEETVGLGTPQASGRSQAGLIKHLKYGGLPGICFSRDEENRSAFYRDWIELTCYRDLQQFKGLKLDGELAIKILSLCAVLEEPNPSEIAKALKRIDARKVRTHLNALSELFVLQKLNPHPSGKGKPIFLPFDCGLAHHLGAPRTRLLQIFLMNERLVQAVIDGAKKTRLYYYRSLRKKIIHLVEESDDGSISAFQFIDHEAIKKTDAELMKAFLAKNPKAQGTICAPILKPVHLNSTRFIPWEQSF